MSCDKVLTKIMATMTVRKTTIIVLFVIENLRGDQHFTARLSGIVASASTPSTRRTPDIPVDFHTERHLQESYFCPRHLPVAAGERQLPQEACRGQRGGPEVLEARLRRHPFAIQKLGGHPRELILQSPARLHDGII